MLTPMATATTTSLNLAPGEQYRVRVYRPSGYVFTAKDADFNDALDSDAGGRLHRHLRLVLVRHPQPRPATAHPRCRILRGRAVMDEWRLEIGDWRLVDRET